MTGVIQDISQGLVGCEVAFVLYLEEACHQTRFLRSLRDRQEDFHLFVFFCLFVLRYISNLEHGLNEEEILVRSTREQYVVRCTCRTRSLTSLLA